jgi:hypothetical protein
VFQQATSSVTIPVKSEDVIGNLPVVSTTWWKNCGEREVLEKRTL